MFNKPKYKLVCTQADHGFQVGDVLTYSDEQQSYGGPWGWMLSDGKAEWQENLPTLDELKLEKRQQINAAKDAAEVATPFVYMDKPFDFDILSRERLNVAIQLAQSLKIAGVPGTQKVTDWKLYDNTLLELTVDMLCNMPQAFAEKSAQLHAKAWLLKSQVDEALTKEEVEIVNW